MRIRSGKRFALGTTILGLVLIAIVGVFFHRPILEKWYLHLLRSGDDETRIDAARHLGEMKSKEVGETFVVYGR